MSVTVVNFNPKADAISVLEIDKQRPIKNIYNLIGLPIEKGKQFVSKDITVNLEDYDETATAPSGRQFGDAKVMCGEDGKTTLHIPSKQHNLEAPLNFDENVVCDVTNEAEMTKEANQLSAKKVKLMQIGVENSYILDSFSIIKTGKLPASDGGGYFDYGTDHISVAGTQYGTADFDIMEFIGDKLAELDADKVIIPFADIKDFKKSIQDCGGNSCDGKGFIKPDKKDTKLNVDGYILVGYHEDTMTPIYAIKGAVKVKSLDANGDEKTTSVNLLDTGMMLFARPNTIFSAFGGLQAIVNKKFSVPKKASWRAFMAVDEDKSLVKGRLLSGLTPVFPSSKNIELVTGLK